MNGFSSFNTQTQDYNNDIYTTQETTSDANTYGGFFSTQEPLDVDDDSKNLVGSKMSLGINTQSIQMSNQVYQNQYNQIIQGNLNRQGVHNLQGIQGNNHISSNSMIEVNKISTNIYSNQTNPQATNLTATNTNQTINTITTILSQADELSQEINENSLKQTNQTSLSNNQSKSLLQIHPTIITINNQNVNPPVTFLNRYNSKMNEFKAKIISVFDAMLVEKQNLIENQKKAFCLHADKIDFIFLLQYEKIKSDNLKLEDCFNKVNELISQLSFAVESLTKV